MAIREIRKIGDEILRKKSKCVEAFDERLHELLDDMYQTMKKADGLGLAAPQVGVLKRVVVVDLGDGIIELVNPELVQQEGMQCEDEGCLSVPGKRKSVKRPARVRVKAQDRHGVPVAFEGTGLAAVAFCHEIDHLDGILFVDKAED